MSTTAFVLLQKLWESADFILFCGQSADGSEPVLILAPASERPSPAAIRGLEYLHSVRHRLDSAWFVRPVALVSQNGQPALVLENAIGTILEHRLGLPLELQVVLRAGIGIASALGSFHAHGFIHRNFHPGNVFINFETGETRLIGAYIAPRWPVGGSEVPETSDANLAFLAPEQTGRMNRPADSRSDLYAFGVMLYKMATGELPFLAKDPMEWVHWHLAVQPIPPNQRATTVPEQLSAIILKLLSKVPEERYQTAVGVEKDLKRCLERLESDGQIAPFPLGTDDVPDQLLISQKIYGRDSQIDTLLTAFRRVASGGNPELVLVSGYCGIGKSTMVGQLPNHVALLGGLFASGKFDQHKKDIPYTTVVQAFQTLVRQILSKSEDEVSQWRDRLEGALAENGRLISNLLPELELVIGKQSPVPDLPPQDAHNRFEITFRRFLSVFADPEHPLALFLDDLQWADAGTLQFLEHLLTEPEVQYVLLIGAYRNSEASASDPLDRLLDKLRNIGIEVSEIALAPLSPEDLTELVIDSLHARLERARLLAELIHERTGGNPFFAIQFFKALAEEQLLVFEPASASWTWDLEEIRARGLTDNIAELVVEKLERLPNAALEILKLLACLGSSAAMSTLSLLSGKSCEVLEASVSEAIRAGLVSKLNMCLKFLHDRVQETAYELIPNAERVSEHLRIGRWLLKQVPPDQIEESIFEIVNQLNRGVAQLVSARERARLADLNLIAAKRAKAAAAYVSALNYLAVCSGLLGEDSWQARYETCFLVALNTAECELLTSRLIIAEERLARLSALAKNAADRAAVASLRVILYQTLNRSERAVEVCLEYLEDIGAPCPRDPTEQEVDQEYERVWSRLGKRTIEELVDLPLMADPAWRGTLEVIAAIVPPSWFTDENLRNFLVARMVNLSLEHGNSEASCYAYALFARTLGSYFGDYQAGYRFGTLSLELVEKRGLNLFKARVYACFGHHIDPWNHHLQHSRQWLQLAFAAAPQAGALALAAYNRVNTISNLLASGEPLGDVQVEAEKALGFVRRLGSGLAVDLVIIQHAYVRALRGLTANLTNLNDAEFDEKPFARHLDDDPQLVTASFRYWVRKLQVHFHAGDYNSAVAAADRVQKLNWRSQSFIEVAEYPFYAALALAGLYSTANSDERLRYFDAIVGHQKLLSVWAHNCFENFGCMEALIAAEVARIQGRELDAERLYEDALSAARENRFIHNEALANEIAGKFYLRRDLRTIAYTYLRNARYCYLRWGAVGKVRQIDQNYPSLIEERMTALPGTVIESTTDRLDQAAVVKALQAISGEIVLDKLIKTLMHTAVEHAGAEHGLFLLMSENKLQIEAKAATINGQIEIKVRRTVADSHNGQNHDQLTRAAFAVRDSDVATVEAAPLSILQYVTRTHKSVILGDASVRNLFSHDVYLRQRHPKSVLCVPITRQHELVGILYLENNLTTDAFTSYRIDVLELLVSQAAISLENARLYSERTRAEEALKASERVVRGQVEALMYSLDVLATASDPERFLGKMLSTMCRQLSGQSAALWSYDESSESIFLRLVVDSTGPLEFDRHWLLKLSPPSWGNNSGFQELLCDACPILCEDIATDPRFNSEMQEYFLAIGLKKFLAVPTLAEGRVRGMISVRHGERLPYRTEEVELAQALAHQVMLAVRLTEVGEQTRQAAIFGERNRVARDVHDTLAQGFTGVIVQLEAAKFAIADGDRKEADAHLRRAGDLARTSLNEARRSVHALRPQALEEDNFWRALKSIVKGTTVGTSLHTSFDAKGKLPVLPPAWQKNLLCIGQEALTNTLKYARASHFSARLICNRAQLRLELSDDGDGFQVEERSEGVGLRGMRERAEEMGGSLKAISARGKGTTITAILPLHSGGALLPHSLKPQRTSPRTRKKSGPELP